MSPAGEAKPSEARWTPEHAERSQGSKSASASEGGSRRGRVSHDAASAKAMRRRTIDQRTALHGTAAQA
jgi:hypothetical protein